MKFNEKFNTSSKAWMNRWIRIAKRKSDEELLNLYESNSPAFYNQDEFPIDHILVSMTAVYLISVVLKQRYPQNKALQDWDTNKFINLRGVILNEKETKA